MRKAADEARKDIESYEQEKREMQSYRLTEVTYLLLPIKLSFIPLKM